MEGPWGASAGSVHFLHFGSKRHLVDSDQNREGVVKVMTDSERQQRLGAALENYHQVADEIQSLRVSIHQVGTKLAHLGLAMRDLHTTTALELLQQDIGWEKIEGLLLDELAAVNEYHALRKLLEHAGRLGLREEINAKQEC